MNKHHNRRNVTSKVALLALYGNNYKVDAMTGFALGQHSFADVLNYMRHTERQTGTKTPERITYDLRTGQVIKREYNP